jgi:hypothetical protein
MTAIAATATQGYVNSALTVVIMVCAVGVLIEAGRRWYRVIVKGEYLVGGQVVSASDEKFTPPTFGCC